MSNRKPLIQKYFVMAVYHLEYVTTVREVKIVVCNNRPRAIHIFPANDFFSLRKNVYDTRQILRIIIAACKARMFLGLSLLIVISYMHHHSPKPSVWACQSKIIIWINQNVKVMQKENNKCTLLKCARLPRSRGLEHLGYDFQPGKVYW